MTNPVRVMDSNKEVATQTHFVLAAQWPCAACSRRQVLRNQQLTGT